MTDTLEYKGVKIRYLGHSGFIIAKGEYSIVLDPFLTGAPMAVMKPSDIKASDILLTHGHQDHLGDAVEISKNNQAKITAVMELAEYCTEQGAETIRVPIGGTWQYPWGSVQFRYAMQQQLWELPAGKLEKGEDPFEAAKRELEEECGLTADNYISLGEFYPTVGYDTEVIYTWVATGLHETKMHLDADEFLTPDRVPLEKAYQMVMSGEIKDGKTIAIYFADEIAGFAMHLVQA